MNGPHEGVRLAKCVAALQACSRRQAEALIASGAVQVAGHTVTDPAHRVPTGASVQVVAGASPAARTVLLHKPAAMASAQALQLAWTALGRGPSPPPSLQECLALATPACGLSVWSDEPAIVRRLHDRQRPLEVEWLLSLPLQGAPDVLARLQSAGLRVSLGHEREGMGQWRVVGKGEMAQDLTFLVNSGLFSGGGGLRRQRIGRLGLAPLAPGQARWRQDFEKF